MSESTSRKVKVIRVKILIGYSGAGLVAYLFLCWFHMEKFSSWSYNKVLFTKLVQSRFRILVWFCFVCLFVFFCIFTVLDFAGY